MPGVTTAYQTGIHSARPANGAGCVLYDCTTHGLIYRDDGTSWTTFATLGGSPSGSITASGYTQNTAKLLGRTTGSAGAIEEIATAGSLSFAAGTLTGTGLADQGVITYLDATGASAPGTPASGKARIYAKTDGRIYSKNDAGVEFGPFDAGGGAATPTLYVDTLGLSLFDSFANMTAWTTGGSPSNSAVTSEPYDATCQALTFGSQGDRYYQAIDSGDWIYYLTIHGVTNSTPDPTAATGAMLGLSAVDNSGNGTGFSIYNDGNAYMWAITGNNYSGSGNSVAHKCATPLASAWPIVYKFQKVGTLITGSISPNGGVTYNATAGRTDSTTFTRIQIERIFSGGGTNPKLTVGNMYLVP